MACNYNQWPLDVNRISVHVRPQACVIICLGPVILAVLQILDWWKAYLNVFCIDDQLARCVGAAEYCASAGIGPNVAVILNPIVLLNEGVKNPAVSHFVYSGVCVSLT